MKILRVLLAIVFVLISLFAIGRMGAGATVRGMRQVIQEAPGTAIYTDGRAYMLLWQQGVDYAWTVVNGAGQADKISIRLDVTTASNLIRDLEANGFRRIGVESLPVNLVSALSGYSWIAALQSLPNVIVVPVTVLTPASVVEEGES